MTSIKYHSLSFHLDSPGQSVIERTGVPNVLSTQCFIIHMHFEHYKYRCLFHCVTMVRNLSQSASLRLNEWIHRKPLPSTSPSGGWMNDNQQPAIWCQWEARPQCDNYVNMQSMNPHRWGCSGGESFKFLGVKLNQIVLVTCAEYNRCSRPHSEMLNRTGVVDLTVKCWIEQV